MRKTPNALNTREQGKREDDVGKEEGRDGGRREEGRDRKKGERKGGR